MKNTLENKAKFFAQYYGQFVLKYPHDEREYKSTPIQINNGQYLELKPLSQITDEDALEVAKITSYTEREQVWSDSKDKFIPGDPVEWRGKLLVSGIVSEFLFTGCRVQPSGKDSIAIVDYLRSKGYALPFMGISVEQQIDWGWIILKKEKLW